MAIKDGIRISRAGQYGEYVLYHPKCIKCGEECSIAKYDSNKGYACTKCKAKEKRMFQEQRKARAFERAVRKMKSSPTTRKLFNQYSEAIEEVHAMIENGVKFDSVEEILVAIQLTKDRISFVTQKEVAGHKADFVINDMKIVLEVDGVLYHTDEERDAEIDCRMKQDLGDDWEIIRISDENINFYFPAIIKAINRVLAEREIGIGYSKKLDPLIIEEVMFKDKYGAIE